MFAKKNCLLDNEEFKLKVIMSQVCIVFPGLCKDLYCTDMLKRNVFGDVTCFLNQVLTSFNTFDV